MPFAYGGEAGRGANLRATLHLCVPLRSFFLHTSERFIRARGFGGGRSRRFRPRRRPSGTTGLQIYIPRQTSALMAKLPSSRPAATPQSRCPSDFCVAGRGATARSPNPERNGKHMLKHRLKRDERSARRFGGLRSRTLSPFPTTRDMSDIPPQRTAYSSPHPYGEAPFFSCG